MKPTLVILAAGIGSRYGSLKQMDQLGPSGESIIDYSVYDSIRAGFGKIIFVIRKDIQKEFTEVFNKKFEDKIKLEYALQELDNVPEGITFSKERKKPWGTAHAVMVASELINEPFAVINADDFYGANAFKIVADYLSSIDKNDESTNCMAGYKIKNTLSDFGYVSRGVCETNNEGFLTEVTERIHIEKINENIVFTNENGQQEIINEESYVSMNFWGFNPHILKHFKIQFENFIKLNYDHPKAEFYIPSVASKLIESGNCKIKVLKSSDRWFGVTYQEDRPDVINKLKQLVDRGEYPDNLWK
ncbi:NDP-sugar synthase [Bacteroidota bacterium]